MPTYIAIDLKSFYASAECAARGLDPLNVNLVVADQSRTTKTICLAVSPALKSFGVPGRPRLFEVEQQVARVNRERAAKFFNHRLSPQKSVKKDELLERTGLRVDYLVVPPRMRFYLEESAKIYALYLRFVAPDKIHVYSIDEVFIDASDYLAAHPHITARTLAKQIIQTIQTVSKITATAGIGPNLYLAKVAMDIVAKKIPGDSDGVRIAEMNVPAYRRLLWAHQPLTDFWRVGKGTVKRLHQLGLETMGDVARCSLAPLDAPVNVETLYQTFGKRAALLIDHAWGEETATIKDIKAYRASEHGIYSSQVLPHPYPFSKARQVIAEMADDLALQLVKRHALTQRVQVGISYDVSNFHLANYQGPTTTDFYGRRVPKPGHGATNLPALTAASSELQSALVALFDTQANRRLTVRKLTVIANQLVDEGAAKNTVKTEQLDLFADPDQVDQAIKKDQSARDQERRVQETMLALQKRFGKNVITRANALLDGATTRKRNDEIGGHQA